RSDTLLNCNLAASTGTVWIDNVSMTTNDLAPSNNLLSNPSFETIGTLDPWLFALTNSASGSATQDGTTATDGVYSAELGVSALGANDYDAQLQQSPVALQANQGYVITFSAKADTNRSVDVALQQGIAPFAGYANYI